jgi:hypothetical protein
MGGEFSGACVAEFVIAIVLMVDGFFSKYYCKRVSRKIYISALRTPHAPGKLQADCGFVGRGGPRQVANHME